MVVTNVISDIFSAVGQAITGFSTALASSVSSVTSMFYTSGTDHGLTFLGVLLCIALGVGLVYWAFRVIRSLIRNRG